MGGTEANKSLVNNAVICGLSGGLGNQMFQYAAARGLAMRQQAPLILDLTWFAGRSDRTFDLQAFQLPSDVKLHTPSIPGLFAPTWHRLSRRLSSRKFGLPIFREPHFHFTERLLHIDAATYIDGYWQSPRYFEDISSQVRADFQLAKPFTPPRQKVVEKINQRNTISVHVRRGDYVTNPTAAAHHGTCSIDWYEAAMTTMADKIEKPTFFVFSDEPEWVRSNLKLDWEHIIVEPQSDGRDFEDMHLMACCDHHVIANSSFSWWGAWLNPSKEKRIIAPKQWFASSGNDTRDLIPPSWTRI